MIIDRVIAVTKVVFRNLFKNNISMSSNTQNEKDSFNEIQITICQRIDSAWPMQKFLAVEIHN
jgi:hypothetical protein